MQLACSLHKAVLGCEHSVQVTSFVQPRAWLLLDTSPWHSHSASGSPQVTSGSDTKHPCPPPSAHLPSTGGSLHAPARAVLWQPQCTAPKPLLPSWALFWLLFSSKLPEQQQIINTQGTAVPQSFPDIWFYLQSETLDLNLGMEQEVRFQSSKINPL